YGEFTGGVWAKGLIKDERLTVTIRARKAVIVGTGGHNGNPQFRAMFHPGGLEPSLTAKAWAWLGGPGRAADASGIIAGMNVGAGLDGMEQGLPQPLFPSQYSGAWRHGCRRSRASRGRSLPLPSRGWSQPRRLQVPNPPQRTDP